MMCHLGSSLSVLPVLVLLTGLDLAQGSESERARGEFQPDVHTLFLAHFNDRLERADYALGMSPFCGNGARSVEGYYGRAVDLRPRGLHPNFAATCADATPQFDGWGFHARGNIDPAQGTFECWFRANDPKWKSTWLGGAFLEANLQRAVPHPDKSKNMYASVRIALTTNGVDYSLPTVDGSCFVGDVKFKNIGGFARALDPSEWHHFALTWSQGEMVVWLDGRALRAFDMTDRLGLVLLDNPTSYLSMSNCLLDELRISNVVRYVDNFEPGWRDGRRPEYAFPGNLEVKRYRANPLEATVAQCIPVSAKPDVVEERLGDYTLRFDRRTGTLVGTSSEGLVLHQGLDRRPLPPRRVRDYRHHDGEIRFVQDFEENIEADHRIAARGQVLQWRITLTNRGEKEAWIEPKLGIPCRLDKVTEVFDGCEARRVIHLARHRDEYCLTLPFAAASGGGRFVGVGIDPHTDLSDIITQWIPVGELGVIRQGTKIALAPGESFCLPFHIVQGRADFDTLDAIAAFHACFPDLYALRPDVPVYSYMPATQGLSADGTADFKRLGYAGGFWGHGPGHDKGDEFGRAEWWDNRAFDESREYQSYTRRIEQIWGTLAVLRECIDYCYRECYDNWYPVRRFHTCPDLTPQYIVRSVWPGYRPNEDPLCFGQYYVPITNWSIVNEYNTPLGAWFRETTRRYLEQTHGYCVGYINDMSHAGALYRHNDPIAQRTPGRSFSRDLGTFVRKALGRKQRYEILNQHVVDGHRGSFWSDAGSFSYTLCAYSAAIAIEGGCLYRDLTGPANYVIPARNLLGEKPVTAMTHMNDEWIGRYLRPDEFTPATLREYYRYCDSQLTLFCLRNGVTLDPSSYMFGRQVSIERAPLMVESTALGRKVVPAARVSEPLWLCRAGEGLQTLLVVGNSQPTARKTDLVIANRYFPAAPIVVPYYGGSLDHDATPQHTTIANVQVAPRDVQAFKAVAMLKTSSPAQVKSRMVGDGLALQIALEVSSAAEVAVWLSDFGPLYRITHVEVDGRPIFYRPGEAVMADAGKRTIAFTCTNRALSLTAEEWKAVELIKGGVTNFCLVADAGVTYTIPGAKPHAFQVGYERGTAAMLNDFIEQYDQEDGVLGNLKPAAILPQPPADVTGWVVRLREDPLVSSGCVRVDLEKRELIVEGPTQGEIRRAMVVLMRLVDRKYPHVGRFFPLATNRARYHPGKPLPLDKWVPRDAARVFFQKFSDPLFLARPILNSTYESLYAGDSMDFAGKYVLRYSPYLFEPTFGDDYVYGYSGTGKATPREELHRMASPQAKKP